MLSREEGAGDLAASLKLHALPDLSGGDASYILKLDCAGNFRFGVSLAPIARPRSIHSSVLSAKVDSRQYAGALECLFLSGPESGAAIDPAELELFWSTVTWVAGTLRGRRIVGVQFEPDGTLPVRSGAGSVSGLRCCLFEIDCDPRDAAAEPLATSAANGPANLADGSRPQPAGSAAGGLER